MYEEKKINYFPMMPTSYPKKENIIGKAREFTDEIEKNIKNKGIFESLGIRPHKSYLLTGVPGTGKTMSIPMQACQPFERRI